ncbi:hypothetical protein KL86DPRO_60169 [uncultured delta proteobacterium]|uniref:Uncharacterized protein n=1 Tax=uncultured delta proteobacterium TaxID=34034 RepID=A0A212KFM0_9DELT|nr:hypothetical protein KL86DPRO_60169 [uncultured delta proteobacterium]
MAVGFILHNRATGILDETYGMVSSGGSDRVRGSRRHCGAKPGGRREDPSGSRTGGR